MTYDFISTQQKAFTLSSTSGAYFRGETAQVFISVVSPSDGMPVDPETAKFDGVNFVPGFAGETETPDETIDEADLTKLGTGRYTHIQSTEHLPVGMWQLEFTFTDANGGVSKVASYINVRDMISVAN